jgi:cytidylate kinase
MIITIDGTAGSGKSTAARKLAARLDIPYLDTGAMYRAVAYAALEEHADFDDPRALIAVARRVNLELDCGPTHSRVRLDGRDVSEAIRSMRVSEHTSPVARQQTIRDLLVQKQQEIGRQLGSLVTEGRDQGTAVFPHADVKFVLEASLDKRAERRFAEMQADGEEVEFQVVRENLASRDANDAQQWAALYEPGAAIRIDTTDMTIPQVVDQLVLHIEQISRRDKRGDA